MNTIITDLEQATQLAETLIERWTVNSNFNGNANEKALSSGEVLLLLLLLLLLYSWLRDDERIKLELLEEFATKQLPLLANWYCNNLALATKLNTERCTGSNYNYYLSYY